MSVERPVVLIHSYLTDRGGKDSPDRLTRACLVAATELKRRNEIGKVVITVTGDLARPMVRHLNQIGDFDQEDIIIRSKTATTDEEVKTFRQITRGLESKSLKTIAIGVHIPRIKNSIARHFGEDQNVSVVSAESVLSQNPRFRDVLAEMKNWPELASLKKQEAFFQKVSSVPLLGNLITNILPRVVPDKIKVALQLFLFRLLER